MTMEKTIIPRAWRVTFCLSAGFAVSVTVFDVTGHAVLRRQYQLKTGLNELVLSNLQSLPNGIYFVKASDGAGYRKGTLVIYHN